MGDAISCVTNTKKDNFLYSRDAIKGKYGYYERPAFGPARAGKAQAFDSWSDFKETFRPFISISPPDSTTDLELLVTDKDVAWSTRDVNLWVGGNGRNIEEISDLTPFEINLFFGTCFNLLRDLDANSGNHHSVSLGFNPKDVGSPGHHNVHRLHTHLRAYDYADDLQAIQDRQWGDMSWFERLTFFEPFSRIFYDFIQKYSEGTNTFDTSRISLRSGVIFLPTQEGAGNNLPREIAKLYGAVKEEYGMLERIFTNQEVDLKTGRYLPLDQKSRIRTSEQFLERRSFYSSTSQDLVLSLAQHVAPAVVRTSNRDDYIQESGNIYITKGFAGAFAFFGNQKNSAIDTYFIPRVISSSSVAKVMFGPDRPTLMGKHVPATDRQRQSLAEYKAEVLLHLSAMNLEMRIPTDTRTRVLA